MTKCSHLLRYIFTKAVSRQYIQNTTNKSEQCASIDHWITVSSTEHNNECCTCIYVLSFRRSHFRHYSHCSSADSIRFEKVIAEHRVFEFSRFQIFAFSSFRVFEFSSFRVFEFFSHFATTDFLSAVHDIEAVSVSSAVLWQPVRWGGWHATYPVTRTSRVTRSRRVTIRCTRRKYDVHRVSKDQRPCDRRATQTGFEKK